MGKSISNRIFATKVQQKTPLRSGSSGYINQHGLFTGLNATILII